MERPISAKLPAPDLYLASWRAIRPAHNVNAAPNEALVIWMSAKMRRSKVIDSASPLRKFAASIGSEKRDYVEVFHTVRFVDVVAGCTLAESHAENGPLEGFTICRIARHVISQIFAGYLG
jgi:hypothetical protein